MNRRFLGAIALLLFCGSSGWMSYAARNEVPFQVPGETLDFLKKINSAVHDLVITFGPVPSDWTNHVFPRPNQAVAQDELFIVYYPAERTGLGSKVLQELNAAVPRLEKLFGWYPYPKVYRNRKLELYFYDSESDCGANCPAGILGLTKSVLSPDTGRFFIEGIYFHPSVIRGWTSSSGFSNESESELLRTVLAHELTHAVYFTGLEFRSRLTHPNWVVEGIAEYGGQTTWRLSDAHPAVSTLVLSDSDWGDSRQAYWVGYTAHLALDCWQGDAAMEKYARSLLHSAHPSDAVRNALQTDMNQWQSRWIQMAERNAFEAASSPGRPFQCPSL